MRFRQQQRDVVCRLRSWASALAVVGVAMLAPSAASAASPVLEYVTPGKSLPVSFTITGGPVVAQMAGLELYVQCSASQGEGEITGPRTTFSHYRLTGCETNEEGSHHPCQTEGAPEGEITTEQIEAELVWIDQAKREVGELLQPHGGTYIAFVCRGVTAEGRGPFLAPVTPIDTEASAFTATLTESEGIQTPDEYEGPGGEKLVAIPMGKKGTNPLVTTGVQSSFTVHPSTPVRIEAVTAAEAQAKQAAAEAEAKRVAAEAEAKQRAQKLHEGDGHHPRERRHGSRLAHCRAQALTHASAAPGASAATWSPTNRLRLSRCRSAGACRGTTSRAAAC